MVNAKSKTDLLETRKRPALVEATNKADIKDTSSLMCTPFKDRPFHIKSSLDGLYLGSAYAGSDNLSCGKEPHVFKFDSESGQILSYDSNKAIMVRNYKN